MFSKLNHSYLNITKSRGDSDRDAEADIGLGSLSNHTAQRHPYTRLDTPSCTTAPDEHPRASSPLSGDSGLSSGILESNIQKSLHLTKPKWWSRISSWRYTILGGLGVSIFVLCCNIALLGWSYPKIDPASGNALLYKGACSQMKSIDIWSHFGINVLSTLLLGASNAAMQCIVAPSRADIDKAHAQGQLLDIGVNGLQNWRFIGARRRLIWFLLLASTLPLHLV